MIALGFEKKIAKIVMNVIDKTIGKKFPIIDDNRYLSGTR